MVTNCAICLRRPRNYHEIAAPHTTSRKCPCLAHYGTALGEGVHDRGIKNSAEV